MQFSDSLLILRSTLSLGFPQVSWFLYALFLDAFIFSVAITIPFHFSQVRQLLIPNIS